MLFRFDKFFSDKNANAAALAGVPQAVWSGAEDRAQQAPNKATRNLKG